MNWPDSSESVLTPLFPPNCAMGKWFTHSRAQHSTARLAARPVSHVWRGLFNLLGEATCGQASQLQLQTFLLCLISKDPWKGFYEESGSRQTSLTGLPSPGWPLWPGQGRWWLLFRNIRDKIPHTERILKYLHLSGPFGCLLLIYGRNGEWSLI